MKSLLLLLLLSAFSVAVFAQPQPKNEQITVDGIPRYFITCLPSGWSKADKLPVVFALHGGGGRGIGMMRLADFRPVAEREHFIVVYPSGIDKSWNDGRATKSNQKGIDDVKFIDSLISYEVKTYGADAGRVYITGMSNGGFMSTRLACQLSNHIAAVVVVGASMGVDVNFHPEKPVPIMYIQGTKDPLVPFAGGLLTVGAKGNIYSHEDIVKIWAKEDHCIDKPVITNLPDKAGDGTSLIKEVYSNPANNMQVIGYTVVNGGHTWPGGWQYLPKFMIGSTTQNMNACEEIWNFFKLYILKK